MAKESGREKLERMTRYERALWDKGRLVAGIDEAGRGPLAGPVTAACVLIRPDALIPGVDDSKKLGEKKREALFERLMEAADFARAFSVSAMEIDQINILNATKKAMRGAAEGVEGAYFLIDAVSGLVLPGESAALIRGDALSYMIAAASIIAKVTRDRFMRELHERYPQYGFLRNKGYGTPEHIRALRAHGPCPEHRRTFIAKPLRERKE